MATLVPTQSMVHILHSRGYKNVSLFSRGVALEHFSPAFRSSALRESWGVTEQDIVVLHVGRLAKEKNIKLVLSSFSAIQSEHPNAKLVFVGDGPLRKSLQEICPNAIFSGMKIGNELATHYASGDLFLFPSITETFGNVVPEALASGLAVVAYDYAAAAQLIISESNGLLVPFGDEFGFVKTALTIVSNLQYMQDIRQKASASVAHLKWDVVCDRFLDTLHQVAEQHAHQHDKLKSRVRIKSVIQPSA
jgi:glycosyltransferase involved in cell wall biosynthesis